MTSRTTHYSKIFFVSFLTLTTLFAFSYCKKTTNEKAFHTITDIRRIVDTNGNPSSTLLRLLQECRIEHDGTLKDIVTQTQKHFLRQAGKERWEVEDQLKISQETAYNFFDTLGLTREVKPSFKHYDYALLMGALASSVRLRLKYLLELYSQGIRFDRIVFLGGARPLNAELESETMLLNPDKNLYPINPSWQPAPLPTTEIGMMRMIYEQMDLPQEFRSIPVDFIDTPMQKNPDGTERRPTTGDTVDQWLVTEPPTGSVLVISNQPYIGYQDAVVRALLPSPFSIDTVGNTSGPKTKQAIYFDSLARWLYQENMRLQK